MLKIYSEKGGKVRKALVLTVIVGTRSKKAPDHDNNSELCDRHLKLNMG